MKFNEEFFVSTIGLPLLVLTTFSVINSFEKSKKIDMSSSKYFNEFAISKEIPLDNRPKKVEIIEEYALKPDNDDFSFEYVPNSNSRFFSDTSRDFYFDRRPFLKHLTRRVGGFRS